MEGMFFYTKDTSFFYEGKVNSLLISFVCY